MSNISKKQSEVDISLKYEFMASFSLHKWPQIPKFWTTLASVTVYGCTHTTCLWDSILVAQTLWLCQIWIYEAVWGGNQAQVFSLEKTMKSQQSSNVSIVLILCAWSMLFAQREGRRGLKCSQQWCIVKFVESDASRSAATGEPPWCNIMLQCLIVALSLLSIVYRPLSYHLPSANSFPWDCCHHWLYMLIVIFWWCWLSSICNNDSFVIIIVLLSLSCPSLLLLIIAVIIVVEVCNLQQTPHIPLMIDSVSVGMVFWGRGGCCPIYDDVNGSDVLNIIIFLGKMRCLCVMFTMGIWVILILALKCHTQVMPPCQYVPNIVSLWYSSQSLCHWAQLLWRGWCRAKLAREVEIFSLVISFEYLQIFGVLWR
jgi:hypothetical protein